MYLCKLSSLSGVCAHHSIIWASWLQSVCKVVCSVLMHMPLNLKSPLQKWILYGVNREKTIVLVLYFIHEVCIVDEVIFTILQSWETMKCCKLLHFTYLFTLTLHTVVREHEWRYHFWNGTGGVWWHLAWELMYFNSSGYKKWTRTRSICPLLGTCCLLYPEQSLWLLDGGPCTLSLVFNQKGISSPSSFLSKDICHWMVYKSFRPQDSCKTRKAAVAREKSPFHT